MSPEEGLQKAREYKPFAITLDILMPQRDGWQLLNEIKADSNYPKHPDYSTFHRGYRELAYRMGAFECLLKPLDRDAMLATLKRIALAKSEAPPPS